MAASPTLDDAAGIETKSPAVSLPISTSAPYAVRYCIQIADAWAGLRLGGYSPRAVTGTTASSPSVPYRVIENPGIDATGLPIHSVSTPSPTASTTPAA